MQRERWRECTSWSTERVATAASAWPRRTARSRVEVHVALDWGAAAPEVGDAVQRRVAEYLKRTAKLPSVTVDVVIAGVAGSTAG